MRVLVTGRWGQVASSLRERSASFPNLLLHFTGRPEFDLGDQASMERVIAEVAPDVIVNAAAYTAVDLAETEAFAAEAANTVAPRTIAEAARNQGARMIHLSTDYVFNGTGSTAYREEDPTDPRSVYGRTKLAGEQAIMSVLPEHLIIRTSWVYSPFSRNFVKTMLELARSREQIRVVADQVGTPTSAADLADAILAILNAWTRAPGVGTGEIFHFAGQGSASWADMARQTFDASRKLGGRWAEVVEISTEERPTPAIRPRNSRLDSSKFDRTFGFRSPPWQQSVEEVVWRLCG